MMGAFFSNRGPVIGLGLGLLFLQQYIAAVAGAEYLLPWAVVMPMSDRYLPIVPALLRGEPITSFLPVVFIFLECVLFVALTIWRFNKEEF